MFYHSAEKENFTWRAWKMFMSWLWACTPMLGSPEKSIFVHMSYWVEPGTKGNKLGPFVIPRTWSYLSHGKAPPQPYHHDRTNRQPGDEDTPEDMMNRHYRSAWPQRPGEPPRDISDNLPESNEHLLRHHTRRGGLALNTPPAPEETRAIGDIVVRHSPEAEKAWWSGQAYKGCISITWRPGGGGRGISDWRTFMTLWSEIRKGKSWKESRSQRKCAWRVRNRES